MEIVPFKVQTNPKYLVIEFFDNGFSSQVGPALSAMSAADVPDLAVLAVTDKLNLPAEVIEITAMREETLEVLGTINTGNPLLMADLLARALLSYPRAQHIAIGFAGHGTGVFDDFDAHPNPLVRLFRSLVPARIPPAQPPHEGLQFFSLMHERNGTGLLTNQELQDLFRYAFELAGRSEPVDLIFFDTCLNGMIEVVTQVEQFADCIAGSNDETPGPGWNYGEWLARMKSEPPANGIEWGRLAVKAMDNSQTGQGQGPMTLSAVRPRSTVTQCFAELVRRADLAGRDGFSYLSRIRDRTRSFGARMVDSWDLGDFAARLAADRDIEEIALAADALNSAVRYAVIGSIPIEPDASGLAFWFPALSRSFKRDAGTYSGLTFDRETGWSSYLYKYLGP